MNALVCIMLRFVCVVERHKEKSALCSRLLIHILIAQSRIQCLELSRGVFEKGLSMGI